MNKYSNAIKLWLNIWKSQKTWASFFEFWYSWEIIKIKPILSSALLGIIWMSSLAQESGLSGIVRMKFVKRSKKSSSAKLFLTKVKSSYKILSLTSFRHFQQTLWDFVKSYANKLFSFSLHKSYPPPLILITGYSSLKLYSQTAFKLKTWSSLKKPF